MNIQSRLALILLFISSTLNAHEYWLDPVDSSISRGSLAIIDVRNGENFSGSAFPFNSSNFQSISVNSKHSSTHYEGRLGDYPAIHPELDRNGLYSINVTTSPKRLTYKTWDQFNEFLDYHALNTIKNHHNQRDLPTTDIKERYFRSAKTLIQVNDTGTLLLDEPANINTDSNKVFSTTESLFELMLLNNPYSNIDNVQVQLLYQTEPLGGRQVELFWKGTTLLRFTATTDEDGIATFKLLGEGDYLINAVTVVEPPDDNVHWLSYWASITFER